MKKEILILCQMVNVYRGLDRSFPFSCKGFSRKAIKTLLSLVDNYGDIICSQHNVDILKKVQTSLISQGFDSEIILVSDNSCPLGLCGSALSFLGYDVSGDSFSHSFVFSAFFDQASCMDFQGARDCFQSKLNENGLFKDELDANDFICFIHQNNEMFERDRNIRSLKIWLVL